MNRKKNPSMVVAFSLLILVILFLAYKLLIGGDGNEHEKLGGESNQQTLAKDKGKNNDGSPTKNPSNGKEQGSKDPGKPTQPSGDSQANNPEKPDDNNGGQDESEGLKARNHGKNHLAKSNDFAYSARLVRENQENVKYRGKKIAFLTFDDGPNTKITPKILDTLEEKEVYASFFIPGFTLSNENNQEVLKRAYEAGHSIAIHSYYHDYEKLYPGRKADAKQVAKEYDLSLEKMKDVLGKDFDTKVWRYPGGHLSWNKKSLVAADKALFDKGVEWIDWNTSTGDAQPKKVREGDIPRPENTEQALANFELSKRYTGNPDLAVILMHDSETKKVTADALGSLIDTLRDQGYEFGILE